MKISMFTNTFRPHVGGVANSVAAFAQDLRSRGHQVMVVAPTFPDLDPAEDQRNNVVRVPAIQNFNGSDFSVRLLLPGQFSHQLDQFAPDIIHCHHPFLLGDAAMRTARHRGLPLVFTHHTLYERYTHYVSFDAPVMQRFVIELATRFANLCRIVIAPSESIAGLLKQRGVTTPCRIVPTGVDTEFFGSGKRERFRQNHAIDPEAIVFGHLGRLAPEKNLDFLARAMIIACHSLEQGIFLVAGAGPSAEKIKTRFADAGLADRLIMVGGLQGDDLVDCYAAMDLFVFASTSETQGMVLTEAMAAGQPVIALDAPGAREVVEDRRNGRLLPQSVDTEEFALAVTSSVADRDVMAAWREQALQTAERFSRQTSAQRLEDVYREALQPIPPNREANLDAWDALLESVHAEWDLVRSKIGAVVEAVGHHSEDGGDRA